MKNQKIINSKWIPKNGGNPLRIEIIEPENLEIIANFYNQHFVNFGNLWKSIKITSEECNQLSLDAAALCLQKPISMAVYDGNKLIGIQLNRIHSREEFSQLFGGELHHDIPKLEIKDDYAEDIKNGPYNLQANRIHCLLRDTLKQVGKFLPETTKNLGYFKAVAVLPEYQKSGLMAYLGDLSVEIFCKYQCEYLIAFVLIEITDNNATKKGMKECFKLPYSKYKENGKPVFKDLAENGKSMKLLIGKAEDVRNFISKDEKQKMNQKSKI